MVAKPRTRMTLPRAMIGSVALHLLLLAVAAELWPGLALGGDGLLPAGARQLELRFVERVGLDATIPFGDRTRSAASDAPVEHSFAAAESGDRGARAAPAAAGPAAADRGDAAEAGADVAEAVEEARGPSIDAVIRYRLQRSILRGRDVFEVYRAAYEPGERDAVTFRDFFRAFADAYLAAYEDLRPVRRELRQNRRLRDLARFAVRFDRDGTFRITGFELLPSVADPQGRLQDHYERILYSMSIKPFVSPLEAGLPAPHRDTFMLLNDEHLRDRRRGGS